MKTQESALRNRLLKNHKKLKSYLKKSSTNAFRLYHKDIPEYPYIIDIYDDHALIYEQGKKIELIDDDKRTTHFKEVSRTLEDLFLIPADNQHYRLRERKKGKTQYQALNHKRTNLLTIHEHSLKFLVNLDDYLDSGLFLDHRPLRKYLIENCHCKKVLNLFCYTGSLSVAAAVGGASVTSVDLSKTYLEWSKKNFLINDLSVSQHHFLQEDILSFLKRPPFSKNEFDLILLDPPSFSNSKRMKTELDIERDHVELILQVTQYLSDEGTLIFSTNKKKFKMDERLSSMLVIKEMTHWTIPQDFKGSNIHRSFFIQKLS